MKKILLGLLATFLCLTSVAQISISKKYKGSVVIRNDIYQVGTINIRMSGEYVEIIPQMGGVTYKGKYDYFLNPDTDSPFLSIAAFRSFVQDNFFFEGSTSVDTSGNNYSTNVETMEGVSSNVYELEYEPINGTITATINGVTELVSYPGSGIEVTLSPAYAVDETDTVIFTYQYQP